MASSGSQAHSRRLPSTTPPEAPQLLPQGEGTVAVWRKGDKNSGAVRALSDEVSRFRGCAGRGRVAMSLSAGADQGFEVSRGGGRAAQSALRLSTTLAPPLPVRKTDLGVPGLGISGDQIARKAELERDRLEPVAGEVDEEEQAEIVPQLAVDGVVVHALSVAASGGGGESSASAAPSRRSPLGDDLGRL
jgi:hypothetical protein